MTRANRPRRSRRREAAALLAWYDCHRRRLPWRSEPGEAADPYRVWLSEIMLQQTTTAAAAPYFIAFVTRWPSVGALAAASLDEVLGAWAGLGYYARARHLHACARTVAGELGGRFPDSEAGLRALPGIGPYTAAAIAAIAFGRRAAAVDGNVERVIARLGAIEDPLPQAKPRIREDALKLVPNDRPGDFAQALMDLGATICTPRRPACGLCPWAHGCQAHRRGLAETFPVKQPKRRGRCGTARPTGSNAATGRCSCGGGPTRVCLAA
jgi:A/G-specific adenine glycosylase